MLHVSGIAHDILHFFPFFFQYYGGHFNPRASGSTIELQGQVSIIFVRSIECDCGLFILLDVEPFTVGVGRGSLSLLL